MPTVETGGARVNFVIAGEGPPVLLIHGTGGDAKSTWSTLAPTLAERRTVVMPDLPGSGATVDDGRPLELGAVAEQVAAVAEAAGLESYSMVGFSLGAAVAAKVAADRPDRVDSLVLVNGPGAGADARNHLQFDLWRRLHEADPELFARLWMLTGFSPKFLTALPVEGLGHAASFPISPGFGRQADLNLRVDLDSTLAEIEAPTLVLAGRDDWIAPPDVVRGVAERIADSTFEELDSGHFSILEVPGLLISRITEFLSPAAATDHD